MELTAALVILGAVLALSVQMLAWVGAERWAADRRQWALQEAENTMERPLRSTLRPRTARSAAAG